jgi:uncharacterized protein YdiU (UPF0061 family)
MTHVSNTLGAALFDFDNTYARELEGFYVPWKAAQVAQPRLVKLNRGLAEELRLNADSLDSENGAKIFAGNEVPDGAAPLAQAYAGHQFGGFVPQLGDGRALLLGEVIDRNGHRRDIQLKGSGPTPFSRNGDGRAALGPVLREYLIGEAMHALGIPTTRALAAVLTGEPVFRDTALPGAVLARVAASHIRVGTFQLFAARGEQDKVRRLADYVIDRHYGDLKGDANPYLRLLERVCDSQAALIASWMHVGFIHGVMNTDNMAISGETIDYGPCAFMDHYDPATVFSSIDTHGRYAYAHQPKIAQWNLARFAETLLPLLDADEKRAVTRATEVLHAFPAQYERHWLKGMRAKLGLVASEEEADLNLASGFLTAMDGNRVDYTLAFRYLADAVLGQEKRIRTLFADPSAYDLWSAHWRARLARDGAAPIARMESMQRANPLFTPRNHRVEEALSSAVERENYAPFETLLHILSRPFDNQPKFAAYAEPAPEGQGRYQTFCGT